MLRSEDVTLIWGRLYIFVPAQEKEAEYQTYLLSHGPKISWVVH